MWSDFLKLSMWAEMQFKKGSLKIEVEELFKVADVLRLRLHVQAVPNLEIVKSSVVYFFSE